MSNVIIQIHFGIYIALNKNKLVFKCGLTWTHLRLTQSVAFDRTGDCVVIDNLWKLGD